MPVKITVTKSTMIIISRVRLLLKEAFSLANILNNYHLSFQSRNGIKSARTIIAKQRQISTIFLEISC